MCICILLVRINNASRKTGLLSLDGEEEKKKKEENILDDNRMVNFSLFSSSYFLFSSSSSSTTKRTTISSKIIDVLQQISSVCEKYNKTASFERNHFFYSPKNKVLYCWIRKVASTSFTKFFANLRSIHIAGDYYK